MLRDHKLSDIKLLDAKLLVRFHGAKTSVHLANPDANEPEGEVLAVGPGYRAPDGTRIPIAVVPGDMVLMGMAKATMIKVDGTDAYIVNENAVEAIVGKVGVSEGSVSRIIT